MAKLRVDKIAAPIVKDEFTGSVYFDGTGDYLQIPDSTDFDLGISNEPFTMELWFYKNSAAGSHCELGVLRGGGAAAWNGSNGHQYRAFQYTDNKIYWQWWNGSANKSIISSATPAINTWHHFVVSYDGTTTRAFLNGVIFGTSTEAYAKPSASNITRIGQDPSNSVTTHGYHSNVRICKGHAVYTGNFTVPTRELEVHTGAKGVVFPAADNRTVLLTCQSSTDATAEATGRHIITVDGDATAADANPGLIRKTNITSTITENTGSVFFDGNGDYLKIDSSSDFAFGTDDFTMECFYYPTGGDYEWLMDCRDATTSQLGPAVYTNNSNISVYLNGSVRISGTRPSDNNWYHVALVRNSGTTTLYVDGISQGTYSDSTNYVSTNFRIGGNEQNPPTLFGTQYSSNVRVCKGHAVYKSQFIPPTRELDVHQGPDDDRTVLLCCHDGENIFADKTGRHIIAAYGDRLSSPTPTATDSPIGITTNYPPVTRNVDPTAGPTFQGGVGFVSQNWLTLPKGTTTERFPDFATNAISGARGLNGGGLNPSTNSDVIDYVTIATLGDAIDFGNLTETRRTVSSVSSSTRGLWGSGLSPSFVTTIDFVTIASTGDAQDFGDVSVARYGLSGCSNSTRGLFIAGETPAGSVNTIDYITLSTSGTAQDFGDATVVRRYPGSFASPTRGVSGGGSNPTVQNVIEYVTFSTTGNAVNFGDLTSATTTTAACSNSTRGVWGGGGPSVVNTIDFITISSTGNAFDFGDLTVTRQLASSYSSSTRGVFAGGYIPSSPNRVKTIDYISIPTTGNAIDFGEATIFRHSAAGCSNGHGGLG